VIKLTFEGLKVLQNKLNRAQERIDKKIYENVQKEADYIEMRSRSSAPVATGELRRSQYREERLKNRNLIVKIGFKAEYAPFQEFGTGVPPKGHFRLNAEYTEFADLALLFKRGNPRMPVRPRRYFLHHYIVARRKLNRTTSTLMKNILK
jgi:HK97 gp10 family phage protein